MRLAFVFGGRLPFHLLTAGGLAGIVALLGTLNWTVAFWGWHVSGDFGGSLQDPISQRKKMKRRIFTTLACLGLLLSVSLPSSADVQVGNRIHVIYMGGNDCPPCVFWRAREFPKLAASEVFKRVRFTHVEKVINSTVPPRLFLPSEVKPLKDKLDAAANGIIGSPHTVIVVDGEVFDYKFGSYIASEFEERLVAIESGQTYPYPRCVRRQDQRSCARVQ